MRNLEPPHDASVILEDAIIVTNLLLEAKGRSEEKKGDIKGVRSYRGTIVIYNGSGQLEVMQKLVELLVVSGCLAIVDVQAKSITFTP